MSIESAEHALPVEHTFGPAEFSRLRQGPDDDAWWEVFRRRFFPEQRLNLNPGTFGTASMRVRERMMHFYDGELRAFPLGQYQRGREALQSARALALELWGADGGTPAICGGTTQTMNLLTFALYQALRSPLASGPTTGRPVRVLTSLHEHYGGVAGFEHHPGFEVRYLTDDEASSPERLRDRIELERPDVIFLSQVTYTRGQALPISRLAPAVRNAAPGAWFIVDAAQALGLLPPPLAHADLVVASAHKWVFGPPGLGFLWASPRARAALGALQWAGEPIDPASPESSLEPSGGQDFSSYAGLVGALELMLEVSLEVISARSRRLSAWLAGALYRVFREAGIDARLLEPPTGKGESELPAEGLTGTVSLEFHGWDPYPLYVDLNAQGIHLKCVKGTLRDGTQLNLLRLGVPYYETRARLERAVIATRAHLEANPVPRSGAGHA